MSDKPIQERVSVIEVEIDIVKEDINDIKSDISSLKSGQAQTNADIRELNVLLKEGFDSFKEIVKQNSSVISRLETKLDESNKVNNERYIEMIKENNKQDIQVIKETNEIKSKSDKFKEFGFKLGLDILKLSIIGGLIFYILNITKAIKL